MGVHMVRFNIFNIGGDRSVLEPAKKNEEASAELIGSIILIGLFVAVFGILLMTINSSTSDFIVPAVVIEPQPITSSSGWYVLDLRAGDTLLRNATRIIVDGVDKTGEFMEGPFSDPGAFGWQQWGSGDSLYLEYPSSSPPPNTVQIIYYNPEGDGILLWELGSTENRLPVANFHADITEGFSPLSVQFTDESSNSPTSWLWEFGDGGTSSLQHPEHTYTSPGVYTVRLTVTNLYDEDTHVEYRYIHVTDGFTVDFAATPLNGTAPLMVTFTDLTTNGPTAWNWIFGDGETSTQQNPVHTYTAGGTYTVTLQATVDTVTQTEQKPAYINVTENCIPGLYGTYVDEFNNNYRVPFTGNPAYRVDEIIWFSDYSGGADSREIDWPDATMGKKDRFGVTYEGYLIVPENDTYTLYLESDDGSVLWIDNVRDTDPVLINNWGENGLHGPETVSASVYLTKGKHPIRIKMTENAGGALLHLEWKSSTITRKPIESFCHIPGGLTYADFIATPLSGASPLDVQFTDLSMGDISAWEWHFGDGTTSTEQNPVHTYLSPGSYTVTLVVSNGMRSYSEEKSDYIYVTDGCLPGLCGTYFNEHNSAYHVPFSGGTATRIDPRIWFADIESGEESDEPNWPVATVGKDNTFSVMYEGYLIVPKDETYTFHLWSDDGSVLWIDDVADADPVVIDNWGTNGRHSLIKKSVSLPLTKGKHPIRIKMMENNGKAVLHLEWESATIPLQPVESFCYGSVSSLVAGFKGTPQSGEAPLFVNFTDLSMGNITSWNWNFGDGATSSIQNPEHMYAHPGQYNVSLTVANSLTSATEVKEHYINVTGLPLPVAWWRFDEASGSTAIDSSGNGNHGTIAGGVVDRRSGACGTGLYFDGTTTSVNVPDDDTLGFSDTFTFAGWFRPEVPEILPGQGQYKYYTQIIGKGYDRYGPHEHTNDYEFFLKTQDARLRFEANGASDALSKQAFTSDVSSLPISYNNWFHLAVVVDGGTGTVYVDGNEEATFSVDRTPLQKNSESISIGKQNVAGLSWAEFYYRGMMDELYLFGSALTPDEVSSLADACTPIPWVEPEVSFTASPVTGGAPLDVQFNSTVTGTAPLTYLWNFGDGTTSSATNPLHTYADTGTYSVNLTVSNSYGADAFERVDYIEVISAFAEYIINENVFVYGTELKFKGNSISGPGATIHITGDDLKSGDLNPGSSIAVSNIYVDGDIELDGGSAGLGSATHPGSIYVNGDLELEKGSRDIYGDVYVKGDCYFKDPVIHGNVYVNGDLKLDWTPDLTHGNVFYTGEFEHPDGMSSSILDKCHKVATVPGFVIPKLNMPTVKRNDFYSSGGYVPGGALADDIKIFAKSYTSEKWVPTARNVIIVARDGDIKLTKLGGSGVTGVLFAPKGKVVFDGGFFEGLVIARDGFEVTSGGTAVTFKNMNEYISNPADYPF